MSGRTALVSRKTAVRFAAITASHASRDIRQSARAPQDPRVVDERVQPPEARADRLDKPDDILAPREVRRHGNGGPTGARYRLARGLQRLRPPPANRDLGARARERPRDRRADPAAAAGDDGDFSH
jgi:hypothetical protein